MSSLLKQKLALLPRRKSESLTDYTDRLVFDQYMRHGDIAPEIKTLQKFAYQLAALQALKAELRTYRKKLGLKYAPEQPRVPAGEPDGGQWTNDGDHDADDGSGINGYDGAVSLKDTINKLQLTADQNGGSRGQCARAVREALNAGGISVTPPPAQLGNRRPSAADYGPSFEQAGANMIASAQRNSVPTSFPPQGYTPMQGDVIVFDRFPKHPDGHTAMFDGNQWISDFRQNSPWPNQSAAKNYGPSYRIYRFPQFHN